MFTLTCFGWFGCFRFVGVVILIGALFKLAAGYDYVWVVGCSILLTLFQVWCLLLLGFWFCVRLLCFWFWLLVAVVCLLLFKVFGLRVVFGLFYWFVCFWVRLWCNFVGVGDEIVVCFYLFLFWGLVIALNCLLTIVFCLVYLLCLFIYGCLTWLGYFVASLVFPVCLFVWYVTFVCFDLLFCCFCLVWIVVLLIDFGLSFKWLLIVLDYCLLFVVVWVWMICRLIVLPPFF